MLQNISPMTLGLPKREQVRLFLIAVLLMSAVLMGMLSTASAQVPLCNGVPATIVGAGMIFGTPGPDVIVGSPGNDVIEGFDGDDLICGLGGNDTIFGGFGHDRIYGNA